MTYEQRTENPCVGGSIPPLGTIYMNWSDIFIAFESMDAYFLFFLNYFFSRMNYGFYRFSSIRVF